MTWRGDIRLGDTVDVWFTTRNVSGVPTSLLTSAGSPTGPTISAFVGNSAVPIVSGITLTADLGGIAGLNVVRVVASSGNGFATATNVGLVISNGQVNSVSVIGEVVGGFSIENRSALMPTTAARTLDVSSTGEAGVDWANVGSPTTTVGLTNTTISSSQVVASVTGAVGSVTGSVGSVTGSVGSVTGSVGSVTGAVGSVTGSVGSIASGGITSGSFAAGAINAAAIATDAIDADSLATDAVTEIQSGLATSSALATAQTGITAIKAVTDKYDTLLQAGSPQAWTYTADALHLAPSGGGTAPTAAQNAAAVWDEARAGHVSAGTFGEGVAIAPFAISAGSFTTGAIDANAIASDAIGSTQLATSGATEIAYAVWDLATVGHTTSGTFGEAVTLGGDPWSTVVEAPYTAQDLLRIVAAVAAGKTSITVGSPTTTAVVTYRDVTDATNIVVGQMVGSERVSVALAP